MPLISRLASHAYYRLEVDGNAVPATGPVLLVANHSNSLMDPALVNVAAGRRVRFMAKSTLFTYAGIGWLVKAVGSVPVYRVQDDPKLVSRNFDAFRDVTAAIADGYAVGIFPEGISHSASRLQPLKTGAARIALGAALPLGRAFPIIPMGLVFRDRRAFRSSARVILGEPPAWDDLAHRGPQDKEAVRELTRRIERAMRAVTLNLHDWADEQLVRCAERVWRAEFGASLAPADEIVRLKVATDALARLRLGTDAEWREVARELRAHDRLLTRLGLTPSALRADTSPDAAASWAVSRLVLVPLLVVAVLGFLLFKIPLELTGAIGTKQAMVEGEDSVPTFRVLYGAVIFLLWFLLLAFVVTWRTNGWLGLATFVTLPALAFAAIAIGDSRRLAWMAVRRFFVLRFQAPRVAMMRVRQQALAERLRVLFARTAD